MNAKKKAIKVIKRAERDRQEQPVEETNVVKKSAPETARDMMATVSGWVNEFQQRRRMETTQALKTLFGDTAPQASKA